MKIKDWKLEKDCGCYTNGKYALIIYMLVLWGIWNTHTEIANFGVRIY